MPRKKNGKVIMNERDLALFKFLFEFKVLTFEQIGSFAFKNLSRSTIKGRMKKLIDSNCIKKNGIFWRSRVRSYYELTPKGFKALDVFGDLKLISKCYRSDSVAHDLELIEIWRKIETLNSVHKKATENHLQNLKILEDKCKIKQFVNLNSDGAIRFLENDTWYWGALEYERTTKAISRYELKFLDYYLCSDIDSVFYICENANVQRRIWQADEKICKNNSSKIFTILLEEFYKPNQNSVFRSFENSRVSLN